MAKINKEFVLSDSTVNSYGFRLLTSGYKIDEFKPNPIGYYMHDRDSGVLVKWDDLQIDGDRVLGNPNINDSNSRAAQTTDEIKTGFLKGASMGGIVVIESSDDPALKLQGQTGLTITKWYNRECSLVDIPGNFNAMCLYDVRGADIPLNLVAGIKNLNSDTVTNPEENFDIKDFLKTAVKDNSITPEQSSAFAKQYKDSPKKLMQTVHDFSDKRTHDLTNLPWDELDKNGLLEELKVRNLQSFKKKFFMQFNKEYKDPNQKPPVVQKDESLDKLIKFALINGDITEEKLAWIKSGPKTTPEVLREWVNNQINEHSNWLMNQSWDTLDKRGYLEALKERSHQTFKQKFKEKFGIDYKENQK